MNYANTNPQIDFPAVAKHFGIKTNAAMMRFKRLKKKLDAMEASIKSDDPDQDKDKDQEKGQTNEAKTEDEDDSMDEIPPDSE
ncbi:hypothetical protein N7447_006047 [Penicillium robsamsonii]|uniref:uncharacterized protein n=1 Tax=Penicillium robsamsonii TaxID=1792511 RepID=UPI002548815B|nr:uncharacterized protein N7447_006047 [Penicillium robsamsonii]KAJ5823707.1 hypothetical protein N7447_006047 [Penicillium robsamsonii]